MISVESNHCRVVRETLTGDRDIDEQTFTSLAVLNERLERLKELDVCFSKVKFSGAVEKLKSQRNMIAVG